MRMKGRDRQQIAFESFTRDEGIISQLRKVVVGVTGSGVILNRSSVLLVIMFMLLTLL